MPSDRPSADMPPGVSIRPLSDADAALLGPAAAAIEPWLRLGSTAAGMTAYLRKDDPALQRQALIAQGTPAGVIAVRQPWLRGPFIEILAVLPAFQGRGLGSAAVRWAVAEAAARRSGSIWTTVTDFNAPARRFWASQGFVDVAPLPDLLREGIAEILLRRRLDR